MLITGFTMYAGAHILYDIADACIATQAILDMQPGACIKLPLSSTVAIAILLGFGKFFTTYIKMHALKG